MSRLDCRKHTFLGSKTKRFEAHTTKHTYTLKHTLVLFTITILSKQNKKKKLSLTIVVLTQISGNQFTFLKLRKLLLINSLQTCHNLSSTFDRYSKTVFKL